jgi:V/A-type H+-transporting ATPase subunit D
MARLQLSKSSLSRESASLKTYKQFLPSLDLKRQELMSQRAKAARVLAETKAAIAGCLTSVAKELPMLSNENVDLEGLITVESVELGEENIMGAHLPVLKDARIIVHEYSLLAKPHWVDAVAAKLKKVALLKIRVQIEERRLALLNVAVRTITQRVNLFDKVLIPRTERNIKRIKIHLSDAERAGVVNAKLAKNKRLREARS